jgi:hypothetical protein
VRGEESDSYPAVANLNDRWRVIACGAGIQWILQRRRGDHWVGYWFCRTREALPRRPQARGRDWRRRAGCLAPVARALPGAAAVTVRLGKLIRLLSSNQPGEVAAAAAAIVRHLQVAGKDIHEFADAAERGLQTPDNDKQQQPWRELRAWCADRSEFLSERELEFVQSLARWRGYPTPKQMDWLHVIEQNIKRRQAR